MTADRFSDIPLQREIHAKLTTAGSIKGDRFARAWKVYPGLLMGI